jgi:hypothetical protein
VARYTTLVILGRGWDTKYTHDNKEENLAHASYPPWRDDVFRDELVLLQEGKLACTRFPP